MVSKKRLDNGFPDAVPRAPRSIRRRDPPNNFSEDNNKLCAFELLAAVAGKLLLESESSASSNVADEKLQFGICHDGNEKGHPIDDNKRLKSESFDHGSCAESAFVPESSIQDHNINNNLLSSFKGPQAENASICEVLKKPDCDLELGICEEAKNADGNTSCKVGSAICVGDSSNPKSDDDKNKIDDVSMATNTFVVKDRIEECVNSDMVINSDSSVQLPLYRDLVPDASLQKQWSNVKVRVRDDDDNSFGCNKLSTKTIRPFRPQPRFGQRRIRKLLTSKYKKVAPRLKGRELYKTSDGVKSFYQYRKRIYTQERCQQAPIKKRKLSNKRFAVAFEQETSSDSISNLLDKGTRIASCSFATMKGHKKAKDPHVKFSIKSFRVPELYIEVPETASVGSLKRTVMEAVTAILGSGIRVGVVLQGKKVRDDNRTLQQAGISQSSNLDTLGFSLEPSFGHASQSVTTKKLPSVLSSDADQELPRYPPTPLNDSGISNASVDPDPITEFDADVENNEFISAPQTPTNELIMDGVDPTDSKALIPVPSMSTDTLAIFPMDHKPKRNELTQRRTRRPFSVAEVEALVEAVEKLGTGRWRDVKIRAFESADHRTYVDLKDKWKTLVHTASISPHQRRGEPVPQELLDRVRCAHSYWTQNQSKPQGKLPIEQLKTDDEIAAA